MELAEKLQLPEGFRIVPACGKWKIHAPTKAMAQEYADAAIELLRPIILDLDRPLEIVWSKSGPGLRLTPSTIRNSLSSDEKEACIKAPNHRPKEQTLRGIIESATDLDWNAIARGNNPVYISQLQDQHNLYLNQAAVAAQSGKPPAEFLSATAHALNYEEELLGRCQHITRDRQLVEYSYRAMRWFRDPETGIWVRRQMQFISNFWLVDYLGQPCWMGEVLEANPLERFLDS